MCTDAVALELAVTLAAAVFAAAEAGHAADIAALVKNFAARSAVLQRRQHMVG